MSEPSAPLLRMEGIDKAFPGIQALQDVSLELRGGEALALLGENGAGKSTLIKILGGAFRPDRGTIRLHGREADIGSPVEAQRAGIAVIYQEFNLIPALTVRENIYLGRERSRKGFVRRREEYQRTAALFARIGVEINPDALCRELSIAQQQLVEIAKALSLDARIIVMDEPSATLTPQEVERLFVIVRDLKRQGLGIIFISHRLEEVFQITERVTVLRNGRHIASAPIGEVTRASLIEMMVGRKLDQEFPRRAPSLGETRLEVRNLCRGAKVQNVSFSVRRGEVLGLTGLVGSGRTETARAIFGADLPDSGEVKLDGKPLRIRHPRDAIKAGMALLTEDRKAQGLVLKQTVRENFGLPNLFRFSRRAFINEKKERGAFARYVESLRIRIPHHEQRAGNLSGGNQQKVVLAKWLERNCDVILFDEPTRGIDVGGKYEVYLLINELAAQGKAVLMISSELPEALGMSDRILVMHEGRISGEISNPATATQEQILALAVEQGEGAGLTDHAASGSISPH